MLLKYGDRIRVHYLDKPVEGKFTEYRFIPTIDAHIPLLHFIPDGEKRERFASRSISIEKIEQEEEK